MSTAPVSSPVANGADDELRNVLRTSARDTLLRSGGTTLARRVLRREGEATRLLWSTMAESGWLGTLVAVDAGGTGLGITEAAIVAEELGRIAAPIPYVACAVMPAVLLGHARDTQASREHQRALALGRQRYALAWQERHGSLDPAAVAAAADDTPAGLRLRGHKAVVVGADDADHYIVSARHGSGLVLCMVPATAAGIERNVRHAVDGTAYATLTLRDVVVAPSAIVAADEVAVRALDAAVQAGLLAASAELLGVMSAALAMTLEYMRTRVQFGRAIGSFQALQHRAADLFVQQELARSVLNEALAAHDRGDAAAHEMASRTKARCSDAALRVTKESIQLHGAIGYTDECDIGLYLKRTMVLASWLGSGAVHRRRYAELTFARPRIEGHADTPSSRVVPTAPPDGNWDALTDEDFRVAVRDFFERRYPPALRNRPRRMRLAECLDWLRTLTAQGWTAASWPREYGGMGLSPGKLVIFMEEQERCGVGRGPDIGVVNVGPLLVRFGTTEQKSHFLPCILSFEHVWCQGYSEPNTGSDLAAVQTRATPEGDEFVVNGQKIWTTAALDATHMFALVRTDPDVPKHAGLSFLLIDMRVPGVTVRPITNLAGHQEFCQVYLDNVRVPRSHLVGEINKGWDIAKAQLGFERIFVGSPKRCKYALGRLAVYARGHGLFDDQGFVDKYAQLAADVDDLAAAYRRFVDVLKRGGDLGPEVSILKIWATESLQRIGDLVLEAGAELAAIPGEHDVGGEPVDLVTPYFNGRWVTIGAGSSEIQRNILARNVLRLPSK